MKNQIKVLLVKDLDSYVTLWINGERVVSQNDTLIPEDVFHIIGEAVNRMAPVEEIIYSSYGIGCIDGEIPENINTEEQFVDWYTALTGKAPSMGF